MFKDDIKTLKEHIYIKRRQVNAYHEINASLSENDLMLHGDFAESYESGQQDSIAKCIFRKSMFKHIYSVLLYSKS